MFDRLKEGTPGSNYAVFRHSAIWARGSMLLGIPCSHVMRESKILLGIRKVGRQGAGTQRASGGETIML